MPDLIITQDVLSVITTSAGNLMSLEEWHLHYLCERLDWVLASEG